MHGQAQIYKTGHDLLESSNLAPYNKLEYLERHIERLKEEEAHLKWLKAIPPQEREWLIKQNFDELLRMNTRSLIEARAYVKRCYVDIRNNVESIDPEDLDIKSRYDEYNNDNNKKTEEES